MFSRLIRRYWWRRFEHRDAQSWQELDGFPALDPREQRRLLSARLLAQVQYFGMRGAMPPASAMRTNCGGFGPRCPFSTRTR
jgi:hypothetical protein